MESSYIKESLDYDSETGLLRWKERPQSHFKTLAAQRSTNSKYSGKLAGYADCIDGINYQVIKIRQRAYLAHRLAWFLYYNEWPSGALDHIDGDGLNNKIENLRLATSSINSRNCKLYSTSSTGVCGVYWVERTGKWVAKGSYRENGKKVNVHLGYFFSIEGATKARQDWEAEIGGFTDRHGT